MESQRLTDAQIRAYAESLAGGPLQAPPKGTPGVWFADAPDGTRINLRSISISNDSTGARWTIDIIGNDKIYEVIRRNLFGNEDLSKVVRNNKAEIKFR